MERRRLWNCAQRKWNAAGSGTRAAPYPYSKMCELCELCELFVKKLLYKLSALSSRTAHSLFMSKIQYDKVKDG